MKQNIADSEQRFDEEPSARGEANAKASHDFRGFAKQLRALGQALEKFSFSTFDLELKSGIYVITGRATVTEQVKLSFSRFVRELFRGAPPQPMITYVQNRIDLRFSPAEIEQFDFRGRVKRRDSSRMPDPYSVSQILRGAGSYLDNRDIANLVGITLRGKWVSVSYETAEGRLEEAKQDLEYFYDYWVKMYMRRSNRTKLPAPSEPTLFVTWEGIQKAYTAAEAP